MRKFFSRIVISIVAMTMLASCGDQPTDQMVAADASAIVKEHLQDTVDIRSSERAVIDGTNLSQELYVGVVLLPRLDQMVASGPFQGLTLSRGSETPRIPLHLFYERQESGWILVSFAVTLPGASTRGPVWKWQSNRR